jgi:hypothetical protein
MGQAKHATIACVKLAGWICFVPAIIYGQAVAVTGKVTNAITHEPIPGVTIRVFGSNDVHQTSTDANGVFRVQGIENCCRVLFDKDGFEAVGPSNLQFRAAANPAPLNLTMAPWPTLRGRVLDPKRQPIPGSTVEAINSFGGRKTAKTGSDGGFSFEHDLSPGEYVLIATPPMPNVNDSTELAPTYFPSATERESAATLVLKAADEYSGADIVVRQAPVFRVAGIVLDERGEPAGGAVLHLPTAAAKATADGNGRFEWPRVRPGNAVAQADWRRGETTLRGFAAIAVRDRGFEDLKIRVAPPVVVAGTVELDGKPARLAGNASLEPIDGEGSPASASIGPPGIRFDAVYPGRYRLRVSVHKGLAHSTYLDSVKLGDRDVTMDEFEIAPGMGPFRVVFKTGGGRVSGTVRDGVGGLVVLAPRNERQRVPEFMAVSFFSGAFFQVENVRPGDYYAFAIKGTFNQGRMRDPSYATRVLSGALVVRVENGGTATVTLVYVNDPSVQ